MGGNLLVERDRKQAKLKTWEDVEDLIAELRRVTAMEKGKLKLLKRYCSECDRQTDHGQREAPVENMIGWRCVICGFMRND